MSKEKYKVQGYPTIVARDAKTGEIKWEKTYKNTTTLMMEMPTSMYMPLMNFLNHHKTYGMAAYSSKYRDYYSSDDNSSVGHRSGSNRFKDHKANVVVSSYPTSSARRQIRYQYNNKNSIDSPKTLLDEDTIAFGYIINGETPLSGEAVDADLKYIEIKRRIDPPALQRSIKSVMMVSHPGDNPVNTIFDIIAAVNLDQEIIQDNNTTLDIFYRLIFPNQVEGLRKEWSNFFAANKAIGYYKPPQGSDMGKWGNPIIHGIGIFAHLSGTYIDFNAGYVARATINNYSNLSDKYVGAEYPVDCAFITYEYSAFPKDIAYFSDYAYGNVVIDGHRYSNYANATGALCSSISASQWNSISSGISSDFSDIFMSKSFIDTNNKGKWKSLTREYPYNINVYPWKHNPSSENRPFIDTNNLKQGVGDITAQLLADSNTIPEYWMVKVTEGGGSGTAKAKITRRPFFGAMINSWCSGFLHLATQSSNMSDYDIYNGEASGLPRGSKNSCLNHPYGYEYVNAGHRIPLFDHHLLSVTRKGVMLSHIWVNNYDIYDKNSTPALPVKMISAVQFNIDTKEIFVACSQTGLYKIKKDITDLNTDAVITKIDGPTEVYAMYSDRHGKFSMITNRGIEFSIDNCQTFITKPFSDVATTTIDSEDKLKWINALATDFTSPDFKTFILYNAIYSSLPGAWYDTTNKAADVKARDITGLPSILYLNYISATIYNISTGAWHTPSNNVIISSPRILQSVPPIDEVIKFFHKDTAPSKNSDTERYDGILGSNIYMQPVVKAFARLWYNLNELPGQYLRFIDGKFYISEGENVVSFSYNRDGNAGASTYGTSNPNYQRMIAAPHLYEKDSGDNEVFAPIFSNYYGSAISSLSNVEKLHTGNVFAGYDKGDSNNIIFSTENKLNKASSVPADGSANGRKMLFNKIDVFEDSGLAINVIRMGGSSSSSRIMMPGTNSLQNEIVPDKYDQYFDSIKPNDDCMNIGLLTKQMVLVWNPIQQYKSAFGDFSKTLDKPVLVQGQEEFTITDGDLTVGNIKLTFDSKGNADAWKVGDHYGMVNYSGIVQDGSTQFSIQTENVPGDINRVISKTGTVERASNIFTPDRTFLTRTGLMSFSKNKFWSRGPTNYATINYGQLSYGGFKYRLDVSDLSGAIYYIHQFSGSMQYASETTQAICIVCLKDPQTGRKYIYPSNIINLALNQNTLQNWEVQSDDNIEVAWSVETRMLTININGQQKYNSGALSSNYKPFCCIYCGAGYYNRRASDNALRISVGSTTNDARFDGWIGIEDQAMGHFPKFIEINSGLTGVTVGDTLEKTGVYDPKFYCSSYTISNEGLRIKIEDKWLKQSDIIIWNPINGNNGNNPMASAAPPEFLNMQNGAAGTVPTNIPEGKVMVMPSLGLIVFSDDDIGKTYEIYTNWYSDVLYGLDEFEEEP